MAYKVKLDSIYLKSNKTPKHSSVIENIHFSVEDLLTLVSKTSWKSVLLCSSSYRYSAFSKHLLTWAPKPSEPWESDTQTCQTMVWGWRYNHWSPFHPWSTGIFKYQTVRCHYGNRITSSGKLLKNTLKQMVVFFSPPVCMVQFTFSLHPLIHIN